MRKSYGKFGVEVDWGYGSTSSTATQLNITELFQIQFNLYMPSSQYDPKSIGFGDQFYARHSRVLTLRCDEIPRRSLFGPVKEIIHLVIIHWAEAYKSYDPCLWENMSQIQRHEYAFRRRISEVLKSMPLVGVEHVFKKKQQIIISKIFDELREVPRENGFFINVDIYHESEPCTPSALATIESDMLKEVRLDRFCSICLEDFDKDVIATCLPCSHIFHSHCLLRWLEKDQNCPLCREPMPRDHNSATHCDSTIGCKHSYYGKVERKVCTPRSSSSRPSLSFLTFLSVYIKELESAIKRVFIHEGSDDLQIQFNLYKSNGVGCVGHYGQVERYDGVGKIQLGSEPQLLTIPNRHREQLHPNMITQVLKSMGVPLYERPPIVASIFEVIANNNFDDPYAFINVDLYEETLSLVDLSLVNEASNKPLATKVAIEKLERVKLAKSCRICKDDFSDGRVVTRFPCLHIFHRDCSLSWLKTDHKCPLCRYPLPNS